jgi:hypothetical protein
MGSAGLVGSRRRSVPEARRSSSKSQGHADHRANESAEVGLSRIEAHPWQKIRFLREDVLDCRITRRGGRAVQSSLVVVGHGTSENFTRRASGGPTISPASIPPSLTRCSLTDPANSSGTLSHFRPPLASLGAYTPDFKALLDARQAVSLRKGISWVSDGWVLF